MEKWGRIRVFLRFFRRALASFIVSFRLIRGLFFRLVWDERLFPLVLDHDVARQRLKVDRGAWQSFFRLAKDREILHRLLSEFRGDDVRILVDALTSTMMVPDLLRSAHGISGVFCEPGLQTFRRLVSNDRAVDAIANTSDLVSRVVRHPSATERVAGIVAESDKFADVLLEREGLLERLLARDSHLANRLRRSPEAMQAFANVLAFEPKVLESTLQRAPELAAQLVWQKAALESFASNKESLGKLLSLPEVTRFLTDGSGIFDRTLAEVSDLGERLARSEKSMERLAVEPALVSRLLTFDAALQTLADDPTVARHLGRQPEFVKRFLKEESVHESLIADPSIFRDFLEDPRVIQAAASNKDTLGKLLAFLEDKRLSTDGSAILDRTLAEAQDLGERLARSERGMERLADEPAFVTQLLAFDAALQTLADDPTVARHLGRQPEFVKRFLKEESVHESLIADPSIFRDFLEDPRVIQAAASNKDTLGKLLAFLEDKRLSTDGSAILDRTLAEAQDLGERLARSERGMERLADEPAFVTQLLTLDAALQTLADDPTAARHLGRRPEFVKRFLKEESVHESLIADPSIFRDFLEDPRVIQAAASRDVFVSRFFREDSVIEQLQGDPWTLARILRAPKVVDFLASSAPLLAKIADTEQGREALLCNTALLKKMVFTEEAKEMVLYSPKLLEELIGAQQSRELLAARPALRQRLVSDPAVLDAMTRVASLRRQILDDPKSFNELVAGLTPTETRDVAERLEGALAFNDLLAAMIPFLPPLDETKRRELSRVRTQVTSRIHAERSLVNNLTHDQTIVLTDATLRYHDQRSLLTCIKELLGNEEYFFVSDSDSPRILDCGAGFGLAIYYFKHLYPKARITAFEPLPEAFALAKENVERNSITDVELLPYALSDRDGTAPFYKSKLEFMGGSLTERRGYFTEDELQELEVGTRRLSPYLQEPVDFLKLDIEGSEDVVLAEAADWLGNVHHIFCEYHHGGNAPTDRLGRILRILDDAGFDHHVSKSSNFTRDTSHRPLEFVTRPYSAVIWATNKDWKGQTRVRRPGPKKAQASTNTVRGNP